MRVRFGVVWDAIVGSWMRNDIAMDLDGDVGRGGDKRVRVLEETEREGIAIKR